MSDTSLRWAQPAEQWLHEFNDALVCDVLVVGTGYGGSFAAQELATPDARVWVLERGREHAPGDFPDSIGDLPGHVRIQSGIDSRGVGNRHAVLDFRQHDTVSVLVGNGLGGGSLINAGVALQPDPALFTDPRWPSHYRDQPENRTTLVQAMDEVQVRLQAAPFVGATELRKFQALAQLGRSMGETAHRVPLTIASQDQTSTAGIAQPACTRCGNCFTGCNVGAKNTLVSHVLPQAVRQGARLVTGATVLQLMPVAPGAAVSPAGRPLRWAVEVVLTDTMGSATTRRTAWVQAHTVVLAAGALGSTEILLRSPQVRCSPLLGQRFSTNGDIIALGWSMGTRVNGMASGDEASLPAADRVGPTITGALSPTLDVDGRGRRVLIEDGAVPSALTQAVLALGSTLSLPHRYVRDGVQGYFDRRPGQDPLSTPPDMARHALLLLGMGPDDADGRVVLKDTDGGQSLDIRWDDAPAGPGPGTTQPAAQRGPGASYYNAIHEWLDTAAQRGGFAGGDCLPNPLWKPLPDDFQEVAQGLDKPSGVTVHPLGGCPMGDSAANGVVDWCGTVFHSDGSLHEGLHVLDGGMLPTAVGVNPFVTIAALSLVAARHIRQHMGPATQPVPATASRLPVFRSRNASQIGTRRSTEKEIVLQFREHLQGHWQGDAPDWLPVSTLLLSGDERQREWVVAVDVTLDLAAWLANPGMRLEGARLRLYRNTHPHEVSVRPESTLGEPVLEGEGWVCLMASQAPTSRWQERWRMLQAAVAFLDRRSLKEAFRLISPEPGATTAPVAPGRKVKTPWERFMGFVRAARNHAQWRSLDYGFQLRSPAAPTLSVQAHGSKRLAYTASDRNLWDALVQLDLRLVPNSGQAESVLLLEADLVDMVRQRRLQVARSGNTPQAMIGLGAFAALWLRAIFQTHFWSLRGLDYHLLKPPGPAKHGPLYPLGEGGPVCNPHPVPLVVPRWQGKPTDDAPGTLSLELTRYDPPPQGPKGTHVLMIHGLAHGATVFTTHTTGGRNMAAALLAAGHTVWLLDHRLSNRKLWNDGGTLRTYATLDHCMDDVARIDIPRALARVYAVAGAPVDVFAHCVGAGAFAMATLQGLLTSNGASMVRSATLHAVHPWVVPSASNQLSGELASFYRDVLPRDMAVDPVPPAGKPGALDQVIDRLSASLPWPTSERTHHNKHQTDPAGGTATCNRMTLFYGREWVHANLAEATHRELASLVGPASVEVFRQLFFVINRQRLTDRQGANVYMSDGQFNDRWTFPTLFCHGDQNRVFDPRSAVRSWHRLRLQHEMHPRTDLPQRCVRLLVVPGYGHMDFLFGKDAHRDVYPSLVSFLRNPVAFASVGATDTGPVSVANAGVVPHLRDHSSPPIRATLTGPMLQVSGGHGTPRELVVWAEFANQPLLPAPSFSLVPSRGSGGEPMHGWHAVRLEAIHRTDGSTCASDVTLLNGPGQYWVGRLHEQADGDFARLGALRLDLNLPEHGCSDRPAAEHVAPELELGSLPWWQRWVSGDRPAATSWLATSCRWPGTPFERDGVDRVAEHMWAQVTDAQHPAEALVLLGDQIYADAAANLFDTQEGDERLAQFYRDAWGSPHARRLLASVPTYTVVDDHELGDNWNGSEAPAKDPLLLNGFEAALAYQWRWDDAREHAPDVGGRRVRGFWRSFSIAGVPAFAMDTRTERQLRTPTNAHQARLVSTRQLLAVQKWLLAHRDSPKVLCSGSVFGWAEHDLLAAPERCQYADGWNGYPATWKRLVRFIVRHQIRHLVFLSGDYHFSGAATLTLSAEGGQPPVEAVSVVCSGWNASLPFANARPADFALGEPTALPLSDGRAQVLARAVALGTDARQFTKVTLAPSGTGWHTRVEVFGEEGVRTAQTVLAL